VSLGDRLTVAMRLENKEISTKEAQVPLYPYKGLVSPYRGLVYPCRGLGSPYLYPYTDAAGEQGNLDQGGAAPPPRLPNDFNNYRTALVNSQGGLSALEATQGQMDGFFSELPFKCYLEEVASVGD